MQNPLVPSPQDRAIDNHYRLQKIAESTNTIANYQAALLRQQHQAAVATLARLDTSNELLGMVASGIDRLNETGEQILSAIETQTDILREGLDAIAAELFLQRQILEDIAGSLRKPLETQSLELLEQAERALKSGMKTEGRDQVEWFNDATRLFEEVLANPVGKQNYVAWFNRGWLHWKFQSDFPSAEQAFYQSTRLSAPNADLWHTESLRHLAYMQYFQKRYADAFATMQKAMLLKSDHFDTIYDTARYAALVGRDQIALHLLEKCIDLRPQTVITMYAEKDFIS